MVENTQIDLLKEPLTKSKGKPSKFTTNNKDFNQVKMVVSKIIIEW